MVTTVEVKCTGHVRSAVGKGSFEYTFDGSSVREFLNAVEEYDVADMLIGETEADATARGWAPLEGDPPETWNKNPEGEQTRAFARVAVNGRFNQGGRATVNLP
nr:pterin cluster protein [Halapricum hydrolyticum]